MIADQRTRKVVHHEWTLKQPAHYTDVLQAVDVAISHRDRNTEGVAGRVTDVTVTAVDGLIVVAYTAEEPQR